MSDIGPNTLTIGGITLKRDSGKLTHTIPTCQYVGLTDDQVNEFWAWSASNSRWLEIHDRFNKEISAELMSLGKEWAAKKKDNASR